MQAEDHVKSSLAAIPEPTTSIPSGSRMPSGEALSRGFLEIVAALGLAVVIIVKANHLHISTSMALAVTLLPYLACLCWGLRHSSVGSWSRMLPIAHRLSGVGTLVLPLLLVVYEALTASHVPAWALAVTVASIALNLIMGAALIPRRIPAYDIPTLRAFAVGVLLGWGFLSLSLLFRLGAYGRYEAVGKVGAWLSVYSVVFAWTDALQHAYQYSRGNFKPDIGRKWYLRFERPAYLDIFVCNLWRPPSAEALEASVSPANAVVVLTTLLTAAFASINLMQVRYLVQGAEGMWALSSAYPHIARWSVYQALLAVVANNFGTLAGTLVIQGRVTQRTSGAFNALGLLIPVLNIAAFLWRYPEAATDLVTTTLGMMPIAGQH